MKKSMKKVMLIAIMMMVVVGANAQRRKAASRVLSILWRVVRTTVYIYTWTTSTSPLCSTSM